MPPGDDSDERQTHTLSSFSNSSHSGVENEHEEPRERLLQYVRQTYSIDSDADAGEIAGELAEISDSPLSTMTTRRDNIDAWFLEQADELLGMERAAEIYADGGLRGLRTTILAQTLSEIRDEADALDGHGNPVDRALNGGVSGWPQQAISALSEYELANRVVDESESNWESMASFYTSIEDPPEVEHEYDDNPFNDPALSAHHSRAIMHTRARGYDDPPLEVISSVDNVNRFLSRLDAGSSIQEAAMLSAYDEDLPAAILDRLAPPQEWGDTSFTDTFEGQCLRCMADLYTVVLTGNDEPTIITSEGELSDAHCLTEQSGHAWFPNSGEGDIMCDDCLQRTTFRATGTVVGDDNEWRFSATSIGMYSPDGEIGEMPNNVLDHIGACLLAGQEPGDYVMIEPTAGFGRVAEQRERIQEAALGRYCEMVGAPAAFWYDSSGRTSSEACVVCSNDHETVTEIKQYLIDGPEVDVEEAHV